MLILNFPRDMLNEIIDYLDNTDYYNLMLAHRKFNILKENEKIKRRSVAYEVIDPSAFLHGCLKFFRTVYKVKIIKINCIIEGNNWKLDIQSEEDIQSKFRYPLKPSLRNYYKTIIVPINEIKHIHIFRMLSEHYGQLFISKDDKEFKFLRSNKKSCISMILKVVN